MPISNAERRASCSSSSRRRARRTCRATDGQREHRCRRAAAVAVALEAPAAPNERRRRLDVPVGESPQRLPGRSPASAAARSIVHGRGRVAQAIRADRVRREKRLVGMPFLEQHAVQGERDRQVGSRPDRQMQVGLLGEARASRIDDDERAPARLRLAQITG